MKIINANFDKFDASWWDRFYVRAFHAYNDDDRRKFALIYPLIGPDDSVVDFGFGGGYFIGDLPGREGRKVGAVEWSDVAIAHGKERYPDVKFHKRDLEKPVTGNLKYDFGVCCEVIEHLKDPKPLADSIMRICKRAVITLPDERFAEAVVEGDKGLLRTEYAEDELDYHRASYTREDLQALFKGKLKFIEYPNHIIALYET